MLAPIQFHSRGPPVEIPKASLCPKSQIHMGLGG